MSCHVRILDMAVSDSEKIAHLIRVAVSKKFGITHATIQFEHHHEPGQFHKYMPEPVRSARKR